MQKRIAAKDEMAAFARDIIDRAAQSSHATVFALSGDLGAGKTTFTQAVATALGVKDTVSSPTFVLEKIYKLKDQKWQHLIHIDAYRIESEHEMVALAWRELLEDPGNIICIEWPEKVPKLIPEYATRLRFEIDGDARIITSNGEESGEKGSKEND